MAPVSGSDAEALGPVSHKVRAEDEVFYCLVAIQDCIVCPISFEAALEIDSLSADKASRSDELSVWWVRVGFNNELLIGIKDSRKLGIVSGCRESAGIT